MLRSVAGLCSATLVTTTPTIVVVVISWSSGDKESFARLEMEKDGTHVGFWLGPSLIDGSFQASMALADAATGIGCFARNQVVHAFSQLLRARNDVLITTQPVSNLM